MNKKWMLILIVLICSLGAFAAWSSYPNSYLTMNDTSAFFNLSFNSNVTTFPDIGLEMKNYNDALDSINHIRDLGSGWDTHNLSYGGTKRGNVTDNGDTIILYPRDDINNSVSVVYNFSGVDTVKFKFRWRTDMSAGVNHNYQYVNPRFCMGSTDWKIIDVPDALADNGAGWRSKGILLKNGYCIRQYFIYQVAVYKNNATDIDWVGSTGNYSTLTSSASIGDVNEWHEYELNRTGNTIYFKINGTTMQSTANTSFIDMDAFSISCPRHSGALDRGAPCEITDITFYDSNSSAHSGSWKSKVYDFQTNATTFYNYINLTNTSEYHSQLNYSCRSASTYQGINDTTWETTLSDCNGKNRGYFQLLINLTSQSTYDNSTEKVTNITINLHGDLLGPFVNESYILSSTITENAKNHLYINTTDQYSNVSNVTMTIEDASNTLTNFSMEIMQGDRNYWRKNYSAGTAGYYNGTRIFTCDFNNNCNTTAIVGVDWYVSATGGAPPVPGGGGGGTYIALVGATCNKDSDCASGICDMTNTNETIKNKCVTTLCGNHFCDEDESLSTCSQDCAPFVAGVEFSPVLKWIAIGSVIIMVYFQATSKPKKTTRPKIERRRI